MSLAPGETARVPLHVGEALAGKATCHVMARSGDTLRVRLNDRELTERSVQGAWLRFPLPDGALRPGENVFEFSAAEGDAPASVEWRAEAMPQAPWRHQPFRAGVAFAEMQDDAMLIADRGEDAGDYIYFSHSWDARPDAPAEVEAEVRVVDGWNNITVSNGVATERVTLYPDHIGTHFTRLRYDMNTTDDFHVYKVIPQSSDIRIYVDGELRIDGAAMFTHPADGRNDVAFGAANSPSLGEALWRSVKLSSPGLAGAQVYDLAVTLTPDQAAPQ